jgi:hypothetical protein
MPTIEFHSDDFRPLAEFPLRWRWTEARGNVLPESDLARIRPLTTVRAAALAPHAAYLCDERRDLPKWMNADEDARNVEVQLRALHIDPRDRVVVSWDDETAVVTDWDLFCRYWDDFCYAASDDVTVFALSGEWVLCYDHSEAFRLDHPHHAV